MTYRARCIGKRTTQRTKAQRRAAAEPLTLGSVSEIMKRIWHPEGPVKWAQAAHKRGWLTYEQYVAAVDQWRADGHTRASGRIDHLGYDRMSIFGLLPK